MTVNKKKKIDFEVIKQGLFEEMIFGSISGVTICIVGHPFDTLKTRLQTSNHKLGTIFKKLLQKEGILALYKGMSSPLYSLPAINAIVFGFYATTKSFLIQNEQHFKLTQYQIVAISSIIASIFNSFIAGPVELFKIKLQEQTSKQSYYKGNLDIFKKQYRIAGISGIFQGLYATMLRDGISYPCQFLAYEYTVDQFKQRTDNLNHFHYLFAGCMGGISCWVSSYPIDTAKTIIQNKRLKTYNSIIPNGQMIRTLKDIYVKHGIKGFFKGLLTIMGRAGLANGCGFAAWEYSKTVFSPDKRQLIFCYNDQLVLQWIFFYLI